MKKIPTFSDRPLVSYQDLTPTTAVVGHRVEYTDGKGRRAVGMIRNKFPGYVAVSLLEVEGLDAMAIVSFPIVALKWPGRPFYSPAEVRA
jgi:hypothetical protein